MKTGRLLKVAWALVAGIVMLSGPVWAQRATAEPKVEVRDFDLNWVQTPDFKDDSDPRAKNDQQWLQIAIEYATQGGQDGWLVEVELKWYVLMLNGTTSRLLLSKAVSYVDVWEEEKHHAVVYVHPRTLKRYYARNGRISSRDLLVHVEIKVGKFSAAARNFPEALPKGIPPNWWENRNVNVLDGKLLSRDETPFAPLNGDFYEVIKPGPGR